jgi:hypothetical protein
LLKANRQYFKEYLPPEPPTLAADLNLDRAVNILDISIVAYGFGSKPVDNTWNPFADLDKNWIVNIIDIAKVANQFGKTY